MKQVLKSEQDEKSMPTTAPKVVIKNRKQRRDELRVKSDKPVQNNRKVTKARKNNRLYLKMAAFSMSVIDKQLRAKGDL